MKFSQLFFSLCLGALAHGVYAGNIESVANIRNCSEQQANIVRQVEARVTTRLATLLTEFPKFDVNYARDHFVIPRGHRFSENAPENRNYQNYQSAMISVFQKMQQASRAGINFECRPTYESNCQNGEVIAYVLFYGNTPVQNITLCSGFFANPGNLDAPTDTTFHELSHYAADTDDLALSWLNAKNFQISQAPNDAYHIEKFMSGDIEHTLTNQIWFWNWPKN